MSASPSADEATVSRALRASSPSRSRIKSFFSARTLSALILAESALVLASFSSASFTSAYSRSEEHTSELQSQFHLVCRLLLEKKKKKTKKKIIDNINHH